MMGNGLIGLDVMAGSPVPCLAALLAAGDRGTASLRCGWRRDRRRGGGRMLSRRDYSTKVGDVYISGGKVLHVYKPTGKKDE